MMRRYPGQVFLVAYWRSPYTCSVWPEISDARRDRFIADFTLRFNTALAARFTRYSTFGSQSKKSRTSGDAKPPSRRTRIFALGKALLTRPIRRRKIPSAPSEPV